jgi:hypothetical protein
MAACVIFKIHLHHLGKQHEGLPSDSYVEELQKHLLVCAASTTEKQIKRMCSYLIGEVRKINKKSLGIMNSKKTKIRLLDSEEFWADVTIALTALLPEIEKGNSSFLGTHKKQFFETLIRGVKSEDVQVNITVGEIIAEICKDIPAQAAPPIAALLLQLLRKQALIETEVDFDNRVRRTSQHHGGHHRQRTPSVQGYTPRATHSSARHLQARRTLIQPKDGLLRNARLFGLLALSHYCQKNR